MIRDLFAEILCPQWNVQARQRLNRVGELGDHDIEPAPVADNALGDAILSKQRTQHEHVVSHAANSYWKNQLEFAQALKLNKAEAEAEAEAETEAETQCDKRTHEDVVTEMLMRSAQERAGQRYSSTCAADCQSLTSPGERCEGFAWIPCDDQDDLEARITLASNPGCPMAVLELLACDTNARVARVAAWNIRSQLGRAV